jgi:glycosyltransferase involved in cell wall biosynthesis
LAAQTYPNFHVLISDDASTDSTVQNCQRFAAQDSRFNLIRQSHNLGWVGNTNPLLTAAKADNLLFAFHDDVLLPEYFSRCVAVLEANPAAIIAYSDLVTFYQTGDSAIHRVGRPHVATGACKVGALASRPMVPAKAPSIYYRLLKGVYVTF